MPLFRNKQHDHDPLWHVQLVLVGLIALQILLPEHFNFLPKYFLPSLEFVCLILLQIVTPKKASFTSRLRRVVVLALIVLVGIANATSLQFLLQTLFESSYINAVNLLISAFTIYITNVVVFSMLYWEIDGGGPGSRHGNTRDENDFLFPQQQNKETKWTPTFIDYFYVSITNAMAFSPTDTMPLSRRAKMLMSIQAMLALLMVAVIAARAVNVL